MCLFFNSYVLLFFLDVRVFQQWRVFSSNDVYFLDVCIFLTMTCIFWMCVFFSRWPGGVPSRLDPCRRATEQVCSKLVVSVSVPVSVSQFLSLSLPFSVCLSFCLSPRFCLSVCLPVSVYPSFSFCLSPSFCLSVSQFLSVSLPVSVCLPVSVSQFLSLFQFLCVSQFLPFCLFQFLSVSQFLSPGFCDTRLPLCVSVCMELSVFRAVALSP